jgi:hypothetical protein
LGKLTQGVRAVLLREEGASPWDFGEFPLGNLRSSPRGDGEIPLGKMGSSRVGGCPEGKGKGIGEVPLGGGGVG